MDAGAVITEVRGREAERFVEGLASLRIRVFRDFPYLYDGDPSYERKYLRTYFASPRSFVALCNSAGTLVGASTAIALQDADEEFRRPFLGQGLDPATICYYGESVLLPELRGRGIGREFMARRERFARSLPGVTRAAFCAVIRGGAPAGYRPLEPFWESEGFRPVPGLVAKFSWKDLGDAAETPKRMQFWMKNLEVR
jgi:GNAT superfamily N-acetyltransferase